MIDQELKEYKVWQPLLLSIMMIVGMVLGYKMNDSDDPALIVGIDDTESHVLSTTGRVEEIVRFIESRYVDDVNNDQLIESAISTVLDQLDPHSVYIAPEYMQSIHDSMEGKFKGIGIESYYLDDTLNVISVMDGSPADNINLKPFDQIIAINDSTVAGVGLPFEDISAMLREEDRNKSVLIKKYASRTEEIKQLNVEEIPLKSVESAYMIGDDTGIIKILRFSSKTYKEFMEVLENMVENQGLQHLIIDLRDNPGGYLPETTNILSQLIREKDKLLVYTEGRTNKRSNYNSTGKSFFDIDRVALLIDENSASGSEIMAGAIQDWDRGLIVGRRSFGKGLVQEQYELSNGGAIRLTVARYYTPTGRSIQQSYEDVEAYQDITKRYIIDTLPVPDSLIYRTLRLNRTVYGGGGITPDVYIPISDAEQDPALANVLSYIPEWTYRMIRDKQIEVNADGSIMNWSEDLLDQLSEYMKNNEVSYITSYLQMYESEIVDVIKAQAIKISVGDQSYYRYVDQYDPVVQQALEYTQSDESLAAYLDQQ